MKSGGADNSSLSHVVMSASQGPYAPVCALMERERRGGGYLLRMASVQMPAYASKLPLCVRVCALMDVFVQANPCERV